MKAIWKKAKAIWINEFVNPIKSIRISYLPPLMIYFAAGVAGLTGVVQSFFVTKVLGLDPAFLAVLAYWGGVWWAFKMPIGHLVDLFWRFKAGFVFIGAALMAISLGIMVGLTGYMEFMTQFMSKETWYIISVLMSPFAYVLQDVVADAMTAEAVPRFDDDGNKIPEKELHAAHTDMQLLGRAAILFGGLIVAGAGGWFANMPASETAYILLKVVLGAVLIGGFWYCLICYFIKTRLYRYLFSELRGIVTLGGLILGGIISFVTYLYLLSWSYTVFHGDLLANVKPYEMVYMIAMIIPVISVSGVIFASVLKSRKKKRMLARGLSKEEVENMLDVQDGEDAEVNWWILGGSLVYILFLIPLGLLSLTSRMGAEIIPMVNINISNLPTWLSWLPVHADGVLFILSMIVICFLIGKLTNDLPQNARRVLIGTAVVIFVFRATPSVGAGLSFFYIEVLQFSESFMGTLSQVGSIVALAGLFFLRPLMAKKSIVWTYAFLTILFTFFLLPVIGLVNGAHEWVGALLGVDPLSAARSIALIDTVIESPFGQVAMVPLLAWIAKEAPTKYKATYFALMASFTNLALSASTLGTRYLNEIFEIVKPVYNQAGTLVTPGVYTELNAIVLVVGVIALVCPLIAIWLFAKRKDKDAIFFRVLDKIKFKKAVSAK